MLAPLLTETITSVAPLITETAGMSASQYTAIMANTARGFNPSINRSAFNES